MVQNMSVGNATGFCVGEPWNAVAVKQDIGFTAIATQDIWEHHPEKALVVDQEAGRGAARRGQGPHHRRPRGVQVARRSRQPRRRRPTRSAPSPTSTRRADEIRGRLTGTYDLGADLGEKEFDGNQMRFFRDGLVNLPRRAHYIWAMAQYQRMGYLDEAPDYEALADELILSDLYVEAATAAGVEVPDDDMAPFEVKLDGITFDPAAPDEEAARP